MTDISPALGFSRQIETEMYSRSAIERDEGEEKWKGRGRREREGRVGTEEGKGNQSS